VLFADDFSVYRAAPLPVKTVETAPQAVAQPVW